MKLIHPGLRKLIAHELAGCATRLQIARSKTDVQRASYLLPAQCVQTSAVVTTRHINSSPLGLHSPSWHHTDPLDLPPPLRAMRHWPRAGPEIPSRGSQTTRQAGTGLSCTVSTISLGRVENVRNRERRKIKTSALSRQAICRRRSAASY